jgi:hypothetical protein
MPATNLTQAMTRQQLAAYLGICTKTLNRFILKHSIDLKPRALIKPKKIMEIIQKYESTD